MTDPELKACPFCGRGMVVRSRNNPFGGSLHTNGPDWRCVVCDKCRYYFCEDEYRFGRPPRRFAALVKWWNTRKEPADD